MYTLSEILKGKPDVVNDDIRILRSFTEYRNDRDIMDYIIYELEIKDRDGTPVHVFKAVKFYRLIKIPDTLKESMKIMDIHSQILASFWENNIKFISVIARIEDCGEDSPIGLMQLYGVQGVGRTVEEAKMIADADFAGLTSAIQGSYRTMEFRFLNYKETEWLREKMANMKHIQVIRGIPKARDGSSERSVKGIGNSDTDPNSEETSEQFAIGLSDHEFIAVTMVSPIENNVLENWLTLTSKKQTQWASIMQGATSLSAGINIPIVFAANLGSSMGTTDSVSDSTTEGYSRNQSDSFSTSESISQSYGFSRGTSVSSSENFGTNAGISHNEGQNMGIAVGHSEGTNYGFSENESMGTNHSQGISENFSFSEGRNSSQSISNSHNFSNTRSTGFSNSTSQSQNFSNSVSNSVGTNVSSGYNESVGSGSSVGKTTGVNGAVDLKLARFGGSHSGNTSNSVSSSQGVSSSVGSSQSQSASQSIGGGFSSTRGRSDSFGYSEGWGQTKGTSIGESQSISRGRGTSESWGESFSAGKGRSWGASSSDSLTNSKGISTGDGWNQGVSYGQSRGVTNTLTESQSVSRSHGVSRGHSTGEGQSWSRGIGKTSGVSSSSSQGLSSSMGLGANLGIGKTYQFIDSEIENIVELLEFQKMRLKSAIHGGTGAFFTDMYVATETIEAKNAAKTAAKFAWYDSASMICPLQILEPDKNETKHLLYHMNAFSPCIQREMDKYGQLESYKYSTVLNSVELTAYTHVIRLSDGGLYADIQNIPELAVPAEMRGEIYMGKILSGYKWSIENGYKTKFDYRIANDTLMHGLFAAGSRSGKTVAALRFVAEASNHIKRGPKGKRLRVIALDPKQDWRKLARFVEPERFKIYSMGDPDKFPFKLNPCKVPYGVDPEFHLDTLIDVFCRSYGLGIRSVTIMLDTLKSLFDREGVFDTNDPREITERSGRITLAAAYDSLKQKKDNREFGRDKADAVDKVLDRLGRFAWKNGVLYKLYCQEDGMSIDEILGDDDVSVLESGKIQSNNMAFIFGFITASIYMYAKYYPGNFLADDQYETLLVIEEANRVLTGSGDGDFSGGIQGQSIFEEMLDQAAGLGLFVISITQQPSLMPRSILANSGLLFAGRMTLTDDIDVMLMAMGKEARYDDRNIKKFFPKSPTGWFICKSSRTFDYKESEPVLVAIDRLDVETPTDEELMELMLLKEIKKNTNI